MDIQNIYIYMHVCIPPKTVVSPPPGSAEARFPPHASCADAAGSGPKVDAGSGREAGKGVSPTGKPHPQDLAVTVLCGGELVFLGPAWPASAMGSRLHESRLGPDIFAMAELHLRHALLGTLRPASFCKSSPPTPGYTRVSGGLQPPTPGDKRFYTRRAPPWGGASL